MSEQSKVRRAGNIDGIFRATTTSGSKTTRTTAVKKTVAPATAVQVVTAVKATTRAAHHAKAHKPQPATTLMRTAVKPPKASLKGHTRVQASMLHKVPSLIASKRSVYSLDAERLQRAQNSTRSPHVSRHASTHHVPIIVAPLAVKPQPVKPIATDPPTRPTSTPLDIFEHALANANHYVDLKTHHAHYRKHRKSHLVSLMAGSLALIVIASFTAYQNSPTLQLKVASLQAGVSAHMPNFKAAGFAYNGAQASDGKLTVGFTGKQGSYELTQQTTNLSSDDMIQNIGATDASGYPTYATVQAGDTTVYRFSNTDATWVSSGKWYSVSGNAALTDSQVTTLVKNL